MATEFHKDVVSKAGAWCYERHKSWSAVGKVISSFTLLPSSRKVYIWRKIKEALWVLPVVKLMVVKQYEEVLQDPGHLVAQTRLPHDDLFQDYDDAPKCHATSFKSGFTNIRAKSNTSIPQHLRELQEQQTAKD